MNQYNEYKDSCTTWMGQVPSHWKLERAKWHFTLRNERGNEIPILLAATQKYGMYPQDMVEGVVKVAEGTDVQQFRTVHRGDFVISLRSFQGGFEFSDYEGVCSPAYQVFYADESWNNDYLKYLFKNELFVDAMNALTVGIREGRNIKYEDFANSVLAIPPLAEQATIAAYLDRETERIDAIIAEAKASIEEYKAWKASIIYEAVTKGLDPNAEMKDSGVEWFGMIPQHWLSIKLRYALENISDVDHFMPESTHEGIPYIMTGDLRRMVSQIDIEGCKKISMEDYKKLSQKSKIQIDDVIFARYATIGTVSYVDVDIDCIISYSCVVVSSKRDVLSGKYLYYYLQSEAFASEVGKYINTNIQGNVGKESMYKAKILLPPMAEQSVIVEYLDWRCQTVDSLIAEKEALIKDMEAYKKSLIFEVATGKRRVIE